MNATKLNKNTQRAKGFIDSYFKSHHLTVRDCYSTRTYTKESIEDKILNRIYSEGMTDYRIISFNTFYFTCGYMDKTENILYVETASNIYEIDLRD